MDVLDKITHLLDGGDPFPARQGFAAIRNLLREEGCTVRDPDPEPVDPEPSGA